MLENCTLKLGIDISQIPMNNIYNDNSDIMFINHQIRQNGLTRTLLLKSLQELVSEQQDIYFYGNRTQNKQLIDDLKTIIKQYKFKDMFCIEKQKSIWFNDKPLIFVDNPRELIALNKSKIIIDGYLTVDLISTIYPYMINDCDTKLIICYRDSQEKIFHFRNSLKEIKNKIISYYYDNQLCIYYNGRLGFDYE